MMVKQLDEKSQEVKCEMLHFTMGISNNWLWVHACALGLAMSCWYSSIEFWSVTFKLLIGIISCVVVSFVKSMVSGQKLNETKIEDVHFCYSYLN